MKISTFSPWLSYCYFLWLIFIIYRRVNPLLVRISLKPLIFFPKDLKIFKDSVNKILL